MRGFFVVGVERGVGVLLDDVVGLPEVAGGTAGVVGAELEAVLQPVSWAATASPQTKLAATRLR